MRLTYIGSLVFGLFIQACSGAKDSVAPGPQTEQLSGIWQLTGKVEVTEKKKQGSSEIVREWGTLEQIEDKQTIFMMLSQHQLNITHSDGNSETCELKRRWKVEGETITMDETPECFASFMRVNSVDTKTLKISGFPGENKVDSETVMVFDRISSANLRLYFHTLGLVGPSTPPAVQNFVADGNEDAVVPTVEVATPPPVMFYSEDPYTPVSLGSLMFNNTLTGQTGKHQLQETLDRNPLNEASTYCEVEHPDFNKIVGKRIPMDSELRGERDATTRRIVLNFQNTNPESTYIFKCFSPVDATSMSVDEVTKAVGDFVDLEFQS